MKPSRSKNLSPLGNYLWNNRISDIDFARSMKEQRGLDKFSSSTVENWRYGKSDPKGENLAAVIALTGMTAGEILGVPEPAQATTS